METIDGGNALPTRSSTYIPADQPLRPLFDYLLLKPLQTSFSEILEVIHKMRPIRGLVLAIGPGVYPKRYNHPEKHKRSKMWYSTRFQPTTVKVGDIVNIGGMNYGGYNFEEFQWGEQAVLVCREADVIGVETSTTAAGMDTGRTAQCA